jgi:formate dehydrogenase subunit delta
MTTTQKLVMMANQIATNLAKDADPVAATARHMELYWDPRMKAMILACPADDAIKLTPAASAAVKRIGTNNLRGIPA